MLGLGENSLLQGLDGNKLKETAEIIPGVHTSQAAISTGSMAPFRCHKEDAKLDSVNINVIGAPKIWILIPELYCVQFENLMVSLGWYRNKCSQFMRHHYTWPGSKILENAGIRYYLVYQQ